MSSKANTEHSSSSSFQNDILSSTSINLTKEEFLEHLKQTAEAIANTFGSYCETLIHDMTIPGHPIIAIWNGSVSGRAVGSTVNIFGRDDAGMPSHYSKYHTTRNLVGTLAITEDGHFIKSTTINYTGEGYHYALGINFDFTMINGTVNTLTELIRTGDTLSNELLDPRDPKGMQLEELFDICLAEIGKPISEMKKSDRLRLIALLKQHNAFRFQKSISYVAEQLSVSRNTIYKYYHELEENNC